MKNLHAGLAILMASVLSGCILSTSEKEVRVKCEGICAVDIGVSKSKEVVK